MPLRGEMIGNFLRDVKDAISNFESKKPCEYFAIQAVIR
jgi:hypothetical protein